MGLNDQECLHDMNQLEGTNTPVQPTVLFPVQTTTVFTLGAYALCSLTPQPSYVRHSGQIGPHCQSCF